VVDLNNTNSGWEWFQNGVSVGTSSQLILSTGGNITVRSNNVCGEEKTVSVDIKEVKIEVGEMLINPESVEQGNSFVAEIWTDKQGYSYEWFIDGSFSGDENVLEYQTAENQEGILLVSVLVKNQSCEVRREKEVLVYESISIPNVFTPNGDNEGDTWQINGLSRLGNSVIIKIYNRWGSLVYESVGYSEPWDGTYNNVRCSIGTYYYVIDITSENTPQNAYNGTIELIR
jgi:gliding motility-associated-like protein